MGWLRLFPAFVSVLQLRIGIDSLAEIVEGLVKAGIKSYLHVKYEDSSARTPRRVPVESPETFTGFCMTRGSRIGVVGWLGIRMTQLNCQVKDYRGH